MRALYLFAAAGVGIVGAIVAFAMGIAPTPEPEIEPKELVITEVELSSENGTQWIEVYNPHDEAISTDAVVVDQRQTYTFYNDFPTEFLPHEYTVIVIGGPNFPFSNVSLSLPSARAVAGWTPELSDTFNDSRTWQLDGTQWVFEEETPARPTVG